MRKILKMVSFLASITLTGGLIPILAQTAATPAPTVAATAAVSAAATPAPPTVTVDGLVDTYYSYNFTNPGVSSNTSYWYNSTSDSYNLGLAEAKLTATQGQASGHLVLAYGEETSLGL